MEEANKLIGAGKKHLVMGKVVEAVNSLQEACGILAKTFGDTADECGEAFFWCGKALLDLARMENSVLGNALDGVPDEDEEDEEKTPKDSIVDSTENVDEETREELRDQVYEAMAEKKGVEEKRSEEQKMSVDGEDAGSAEDTCDAGNEENQSEDDKGEAEKEDEAQNKEAERQSDEEEEAAEDGEEEEEGGGSGEEMGDKAEEKGDAAAADKDSEDEEVGNLQLAWEMLEVAKVIYKRREAKDDQLMAAQAHLKLGEVSVESGNYAQALEDFQECLRLQVKHLDADSRLLAETHYQLGLTHGLNLQHGQAVAELNRSVSVIKSRLDKLRELVEKAGGPEDLPEEAKEMEELKALLPEIQEKVEDASESLKTASTAKSNGDASSSFSGSSVQTDESSKMNGSGTNGPGPTSGRASADAASDISHLVRKKRKPESPKKEGEVKKMKQDGGTTQTQNGATPEAQVPSQPGL